MFNRESSPPAENGWRSLSRAEIGAVQEAGHTNIFGTRRAAAENEFYRQAMAEVPRPRRDWDRGAQEQVIADNPNQTAYTPAVSRSPADSPLRFVPPRFSPGVRIPAIRDVFSRRPGEQGLNLNQDVFPQEAARDRDNDTPTPLEEGSDAWREQLRRDWQEYRRQNRDVPVTPMNVPSEFMVGSRTISAESAAELREQINNVMQRTDTRAFNGERLGVPYTPAGPAASVRATLAALGSSLRVPAPVFRGTTAGMAQREADAAAYLRDLTVPQAALTAAMRDATPQHNADVAPDELRDLM